jgi:hypothetical protein
MTDLKQVSPAASKTPKFISEAVRDETKRDGRIRETEEENRQPREDWNSVSVDTV